MTTLNTNFRVRSLGFGVLLVILFAFTATPVMGQMTGMGGMDIKLGGRAGLTFMTVGGDDADDDLDRRTGFMLGGFALVDLEGPLTLQPELTYIQKGATDPDSDLTTKLDYIEVPVLVKFQLPVTGPVSPNLFGGPTLGFNVTSEVENDDGDTQNIDDTNGAEFGLALGGGIDFGLVGTGTLMVDVRYELGLTSIDDSDADLSAHNQGFMITAGFVF